MASRRMVDQAFWESETVAKWDYFQRLLFIGMFCKADDQGRIKANTAWIRAQVFPFDDVDVGTIQNALDLFVTAESILIYEVDGISYLQFLKWWTWQKHSWAWPSKYPGPPDWEDRVCYRKGNTVIKSNWGESGTKEKPKPSPSDPTADPPRPRGDTSLSSAPSTSTSGSTRGSTSGSTSNNNTAGAENPAVADVLQKVHDLGITEPKAGQLVTDYAERGDLPELVPRLTAWLSHCGSGGKAGKDQFYNPVGFAIDQTEAGHDPPAPDDSRRVVMCPKCHAHPCLCEELGIVEGHNS